MLFIGVGQQIQNVAEFLLTGSCQLRALGGSSVNKLNEVEGW